MLDITRCAGCCVPPDVWQILDGVSTNDFDMPCLMLDHTPLNTEVKNNAEHRFLVDGVPTSFMSAVTESDEVKLGDYGLHTESAFVREGNLFEDIGSLTTNLHINPKDPIPRPTEHKVRPEDSTTRETNVIESVRLNRRLSQWEVLVMWDPKAYSLPIDPHVVSLLKRLPRHLDLEDRWLVTTVIECTDCSGAHTQGIIGVPPTWRNSGVFYKRDIRKYFRMLLRCHQYDMVEGDNKTAKTEGQDAIVFFRNLLGGGRFKVMYVVVVLL
ncbi:hypothetical protein EDC04DRAFT_295964 [Pisolithus marmoratus]|nr:hypothetical protein EDC04DRAFT_295964 [Pisolithus marmoratus]